MVLVSKFKHISCYMESVSVVRTNTDYFRYGVEHVLREFYTVFNKSVDQKLSHF